MNDKFNDRKIEQLENELRPTLSTYLTKSPSNAETNQLVKSLLPELERTKQALKPSIFKQCLGQMRHYRWSFWGVSIAVFLMLSLIAPAFFHQGNLFTFIFPLYVLICIGYSYRSWNKEMRMLETITPFPPALLLLIRMIDVLAINVLFGLAGSTYLAIDSKIMPILFVMEWLAPSLLMFGMLAYMTLWKGMKWGFTVGTVVWLALMIGSSLMGGLDQLTVYLLALLALSGLGLLAVAYRKAIQQYRFQV